MKKYIAPSLKAINLSGEDIIQTSGDVTTANVPTTVVNGAQATNYGTTNFGIAYGNITSTAQ